MIGANVQPPNSVLPFGSQINSYVPCSHIRCCTQALPTSPFLEPHSELRTPAALLPCRAQAHVIPEMSQSSRCWCGPRCSAFGTGTPSSHLISSMTGLNNRSTEEHTCRDDCLATIQSFWSYVVDMFEMPQSTPDAAPHSSHCTTRSLHVVPLLIAIFSLCKVRLELEDGMKA